MPEPQDCKSLDEVRSEIDRLDFLSSAQSPSIMTEAVASERSERADS